MKVQILLVEADKTIIGNVELIHEQGSYYAVILNPEYPHEARNVLLDPKHLRLGLKIDDETTALYEDQILDPFVTKQ